LTLEKKMPTIITERRLHDFTITTAGKDASITALLYVAIEIFIMIPQAIHLLNGIYIGSIEFKCFIKQRQI